MMLECADCTEKLVLESDDWPVPEYVMVPVGVTVRDPPATGVTEPIPLFTDIEDSPCDDQERIAD